MKNLQGIKSRIQLILFGVISNILIILLSIAGCSDPTHTGPITSYTGSMQTHLDVDDYLTSVRGGTYCIHKDTDSSCIDLIPLVNRGRDTKGPIIHIYPEKTVYLFYHEGAPIVRVERIGDTTEFVETLGDGDQDSDNNGDDNNGTNGGNGNGTNGGNGNGTNGGNGNGTNGGNGNGTNGGNGNGTNGDNNNGTNVGDDDDDNGTNGGNGNGTNGDDDNDDNNGTNGDDNNDDNPKNTEPTDNTNDGHGWLIWIYYPEGAAPINPPTLSESKVTVTINGKQLADEDITGFARFIGSDDERGIQFFYPTESAELLDLQVQMIGITDDEGDVRFNINYLWHSN